MGSECVVLGRLKNLGLRVVHYEAINSSSWNLFPEVVDVDLMELISLLGTSCMVLDD